MIFDNFFLPLELISIISIFLYFWCFGICRELVCFGSPLLVDFGPLVGSFWNLKYVQFLALNYPYNSPKYKICQNFQKGRNMDGDEFYYMEANFLICHTENASHIASWKVIFLLCFSIEYQNTGIPKKSTHSLPTSTGRFLSALWYWCILSKVPDSWTKIWDFDLDPPIP